MIQLFFILCVSLSVCAQEWKEYQLETGCRIFNIEGKVLKSFPGDICIYFDDGKILIAKDEGLDLYDKGFKHLWHLPGHFHHGIDLSNNQKNILAMASVFEKHKKNKKRLDQLMIINLEGKVLHKVLATTLLEKAGIKPHTRRSGHTDVEISHFNSFFEIPLIKDKKESPYLKEGNFIANSKEDGIFILSPDLQKVEFSTKLPQSVRHQVHDAQILENGNLLIFNNLTMGAAHDLKYSSVQEIDLSLNKVLFEFTTNPKAAFYSQVSGAVQKLDEDHYLISHVYTGSFIYSKNKKNFFSVTSHTHFRDGQPFPAHKVRLRDLRMFLSHWK